jgi:hypothetical protein
MAKRKELVALRSSLESEIKKLTCDIDHLDGAISLFDATATPRAVQRYVTKHRAKKGRLKAFVLDALRAASGPITSRDITEAWIKDRELNADEATFVILRKRTGAVLTKLRVQGVIQATETAGDYKAWRLESSTDSARCQH